MKDLKEYLKKLDDKMSHIEEDEILNEIHLLVNKDKNATLGIDAAAELIAFELTPKNSSQKHNWKSYYGPRLSLRDGQGNLVDSPKLQEINEHVINYWQERSIESLHPVLTNRYSDLVYDFSPIVLKRKTNVDSARKVIDSAIEICNQGLNDLFGCMNKLERALNLAVQCNEIEKIKILKQVIVSTEDKFAVDDKAGLWGHAFKLILLNPPKRLVLSDFEKTSLVKAMEERLSRLIAIDDPNPWCVERAVELLGEYYARTKDAVELERLLDVLEMAFRKSKRANSDGILINNYLQKLIDIYLDYSSKGFKFAKQKYDKILNELNNTDGKRKFKMNSVSTEFIITDEQVARWVELIFGKEDTRSLEEVVGAIAFNFILDKKQIEAILQRSSKKYVFLSLAKQTIISPEGYPIASFGGINDSFDERLMEMFSQHLSFGAFFPRKIFEELKLRYEPSDMAKIFLLSPIFNSDDESLVLKLLEHFWTGNFFEANCIGIPMIEGSIRKLHALNNATYIKRNSSYGYDVMNLGQLLQSGLINHVFKQLNKDLVYYLRVLLTERIGWNMRNNLAHGINLRTFQSEDAANRTMHVIFCLALIRSKNSKL